MKTSRIETKRLFLREIKEDISYECSGGEIVTEGIQCRYVKK